MEKKLQLQILSKEIIKPLTPTPFHLRNHQLCFFDQFAPYIYLDFLFFYKNSEEVSNTARNHSELLKRSLSMALTQYYPFSGRLNDAISAVDCNDEGVTFLETRINCDMSQIIITNSKDSGTVPELLFSDNLQGKDQRFNPLLSIQSTQFDCGGIAIAVFLSHKLADMTTFVNFMNDWASIARGSSVNPRFDAADFFHPVDFQGHAVHAPTKSDENISTKRFEFKGSHIERLKAIVSEKLVDQNKKPTRVEVVTAIIYKALASISKNKPSYLLQILNLRPRVVPPLPENLIGNIVSVFVASETDTEEIEVWRCVADMKRNLEIFCNKYPKNYKTAEEWTMLYQSHMEEIIGLLRNEGNQPLYVCNSWCRIPIYETDFGWGKPIWVTQPTDAISKKNMFILMDTKDGDGSIEAFVTLDTKEMIDFQRNIEHLLNY